NCFSSLSHLHIVSRQTLIDRSARSPDRSAKNVSRLKENFKILFRLHGTTTAYDHTCFRKIGPVRSRLSTISKLKWRSRKIKTAREFFHLARGGWKLRYRNRIGTKADRNEFRSF